MGSALMSEPALASAAKSGSLRVNNFDLIRLLASTQVLGVHLMMYFYKQVPTGTLGVFYKIFMNLPGIPIFFVISGYLISLSKSGTGLTKMYALATLTNLRVPGVYLDYGVLAFGTPNWRAARVWQLKLC